MFAQRYVFEAPQFLIDRVVGQPLSRAVIAGSNHELPMQAAADATRLGLIKPILVGDEQHIRSSLADQSGWDLEEAEIIDLIESDDPVTRSIEITQRAAGNMLVKGYVDTSRPMSYRNQKIRTYSIVPTAHCNRVYMTNTLLILVSGVLRRESGLRTNRRLTYAFYLTSPTWTYPLIVRDAALTVDPDLETKRHVVRNAVTLAQAAGIQRPRLAILIRH